MDERVAHNNSLNTIRLLGAIQVFYYHAITHLHISMPVSITKSVLFIMGVPIFFFLSGFLNWFSSSRSVNASDYYKKRFLRIYPELWIAILLEISTIFILYDKSINWPLLGIFAFTQGTVFQFWTPDFLRSFGCGCPNGALWTICMIIQYYLIAYPLQRWIKNKSIWTWLLILTVSIAVGILSNYLMLLLPIMAGKLYSQLVFRYFWLFFLGSFVGRFSKILLPLLKKWFLFFLITSFIIWVLGIDINTGHYGILRSTFFCLGSLALAYAWPWLNIKTDISYAVYIYHMIVVTAFIELNITGQKIHLLWVAIIVFVISFISTRTIGRLSQNWKHRFTKSSL